MTASSVFEEQVTSSSINQGIELGNTPIDRQAKLPQLRLTVAEVIQRKDFMRCDQYLSDVLAAMKKIGFSFRIQISEFSKKIGLSLRTFQRARKMLINSGRLIENRINRDSIEFFLVPNPIALNDQPIALNDQPIALNDQPIALKSLKPSPSIAFETSPTPITTNLINSLDPDLEREQILKVEELTEEIEPKIIEEIRSPIPKPIKKSLPEKIKSGCDKLFRRDSTEKEFIPGAWGENIFSIHEGFIAVMVAQWRKGDTPKSKAFGAMATEEVEACIRKYWLKDCSRIAIDWQAFVSSTQRMSETIATRIESGVEIQDSEKRAFVSRVSPSCPAAPLSSDRESLRSAQPSAGFLPVALGTVSEISDEIRSAIDRAKKTLKYQY